MSASTAHPAPRHHARPSGSAVLLRLLHVYRSRISPLFGPRCRYYPTCSAYAVNAVTEHGALRGTVLAAWRLLRCNPLSSGGVDDVPERFALHLHAHDRWPSPGDEQHPDQRVAAPKE